MESHSQSGENDRGVDMGAGGHREKQKRVRGVVFWSIACAWQHRGYSLLCEVAEVASGGNHDLEPDNVDVKYHIQKRNIY